MFRICKGGAKIRNKHLNAYNYEFFSSIAQCGTTLLCQPTVKWIRTNQHSQIKVAKVQKKYAVNMMARGTGISSPCETLVCHRPPEKESACGSRFIEYPPGANGS